MGVEEEEQREEGSEDKEDETIGGENAWLYVHGLGVGAWGVAYECMSVQCRLYGLLMNNRCAMEVHPIINSYSFLTDITIIIK